MMIDGCAGYEALAKIAPEKIMAASVPA